MIISFYSFSFILSHIISLHSISYPSFFFVQLKIANVLFLNNHFVQINAFISFRNTFFFNYLPNSDLSVLHIKGLFVYFACHWYFPTTFPSLPHLHSFNICFHRRRLSFYPEICIYLSPCTFGNPRFLSIVSRDYSSIQIFQPHNSSPFRHVCAAVRARHYFFYSNFLFFFFWLHSYWVIDWLTIDKVVFSH